MFCCCFSFTILPVKRKSILIQIKSVCSIWPLAILFKYLLSLTLGNPLHDHLHLRFCGGDIWLLVLPGLSTSHNLTERLLIIGLFSSHQPICRSQLDVCDQLLGTHLGLWIWDFPISYLYHCSAHIFRNYTATPKKTKRLYESKLLLHFSHLLLLLDPPLFPILGCSCWKRHKSRGEDTCSISCFF